MISTWPPLPPSAHRARASLPAAFPLGDERCVLFQLGRHALHAGARACGLGPGDEALVPEYHHGAEIEALARAGVTCVFYPVGEDLAPDPEAVDRLTGPRTRAVLLIHTYGMPQDAPRWRRLCDERGLLLIEDVAQGWPGRRDGEPLGAHGHLSIFCLYKAFGFPDGAALWLNPRSAFDAPPHPRGRRRVGAARVARKHGAWILQHRDAAPPTRTRPFVAEHAFALGEPRPASRATSWLLPRAVDVAAAELRRGNYERLRISLEGVGSADAAPAPEGAAPFVFPFAARRKAEVLAELRRIGVRALDFWSMPHPSLQSASPRVDALRRQIVGLPVHQELPDGALDRIVAAVLRAS